MTTTTSRIWTSITDFRGTEDPRGVVPEYYSPGRCNAWATTAALRRYESAGAILRLPAGANRMVFTRGDLQPQLYSWELTAIERTMPGRYREIISCIRKLSQYMPVGVYAGIRRDDGTRMMTAEELLDEIMVAVDAGATLIGIDASWNPQTVGLLRDVRRRLPESVRLVAEAWPNIKGPHLTDEDDGIEWLTKSEHFENRLVGKNGTPPALSMEGYEDRNHILLDRWDVGHKAGLGNLWWTADLDHYAEALRDYLGRGLTVHLDLPHVAFSYSQLIAAVDREPVGGAA